ncbi:MAG: hypothetical protein C4541_09920 [Candidatus Auribacter fodinae]|jgi:hypothetical protein|uniref:Uncharacterized protein n=1 Tax=Candidatus Auribacter fodinae TaxID=2093366 RepID=A0A3A4QUF0_9BACT|nr:MAG: hypothetical protein C4541_09920 [Candidatus Auribacter fodinae]
MNNNFFINKPVHSDFLVHWTGEDIDKEHDQKWYENPKNQSLTNQGAFNAYLERLKYILKYGLWMIESNDGEKIVVNKQSYDKPIFPRTCFTELRLSEARKHAKRFGRLGIGFKRYYLFDRLGAPMIYVQEGTESVLFPPFSKKDFDESNPACSFLKHMCPSDEKPKNYKYFDESEWRIVFSNRLDKKYYKCPDEINDEGFNDYINKAGKKPKYLLPLDKWFSFIIYPSLHVKVAAEQDTDIRNEINRIKPSLPRRQTVNCLQGTAGYEMNSKPIEIDLDACRNF